VKNNMKILIVGAGRIGSNLAKTLSEENHGVFVIEQDEETARKADEQLDVKVITGSGTDPEILKQAGVVDADLVVAVTLSDETNIAVCALAASYGVKRRIARVRHKGLSDEIMAQGYAYFHLHEIINPEEVAAKAITKAIETPGACEIGEFAEGKLFLRAFDVPEHSPMCGLPIEEFHAEDFPWPFLVVAVKRNDDVIIPKGETTINPLDRIYVLLPSKSVGEFLSFIDPNLKKPKKVIIYGATATGEHVAKTLAEKVKHLVLLEEDNRKAEQVAGKIDSLRVIQGSGAEKEVLKEKSSRKGISLTLP